MCDVCEFMCATLWLSSLFVNLLPLFACTDPVPWFPRSLVSVLALALLLDRLSVRSAVASIRLR
jgi:hypothetical protein